MPGLQRLFSPRAIAVVGATPREDSYAFRTLANLRALAYGGRIVGVHPTRREVAGVACVPSLSDLDEAVDAVVIATPAAGVPAIVDEAGAIGCGGAVVFAAGFGETAGGRELERELAAAAARHGLPVCGPNGNGIVVMGRGVALWGDPLQPRPAGGVALVSQSGNLGVNALAVRGGLGLHSVVSCGNQAVLDAADYVTWLAGDDDVRAIALYLEAPGDGAKLCGALAACAERDLPVVILKVGSSARAAAAALAHTGSVAGEHRVFEALCREAGAVMVDDPVELLELAKTLALTGRAPRPGVAVLTCSGGDAAIAADMAERLEVQLPPLGPATRTSLQRVLPEAATAHNPLDYTSLLWGDRPALESMLETLAADPEIGTVLSLYDATPDEAPSAIAEHERIVAAHVTAAAAAAEHDVSLLRAATLPALVDDDRAEALAVAGIASVGGIATALRAAGARHRPQPDPARMLEIAATARAGQRPAASTGSPGDGRPEDRAADAARPDGDWLGEHAAKRLLAEAGVRVPENAIVRDAGTAVAVAERLGYPVALKLTHPSLQHKSDVGALVLDLADATAVASAYDQLRIRAPHPDAEIFVERMVDGGAELLVAAHRDGVVPCLVLAAGGIWAESFDDAVIVPLPADRERVAGALRQLRYAGAMTGARGRPALALDAAAELAAAAGQALLDHDLALIELNPVIVSLDRAVAADAVVRCRQH